jgi:hypothetical protein
MTKTILVPDVLNLLLVFWGMQRYPYLWAMYMAVLNRKKHGRMGYVWSKNAQEILTACENIG